MHVFQPIAEEIIHQSAQRVVTMVGSVHINNQSADVEWFVRLFNHVENEYCVNYYMLYNEHGIFKEREIVDDL